MRFGMITEDPFYDEDGVLIDEDADWADVDPGDLVWIPELGEHVDIANAEWDEKQQEWVVRETHSPFDTINS